MISENSSDKLVAKSESLKFPLAKYFLMSVSSLYLLSSPIVKCIRLDEVSVTIDSVE